MQAAEAADHVESGPQPEMERVAEDDLRAERREFDRVDALDGAVRADRHEDGRVDDAVRERQAAATGGTVDVERFEVQRMRGGRTKGE